MKCLILVLCRIRLHNSPGPSLFDFSFSDAPNVFYWWKVRTAGRPVQPSSSPTEPCCCHGYSAWFSIVLLKYVMPFLKETLSGLDLEYMLLLALDGALHFWIMFTSGFFFG